MAKLNIRPLDDRLVVRRVEAEEKTKGRIVLPDRAKEKPKKGEVLAFGTGKLLDDGRRAAIAAGIVDPTKVCRIALENAASVAGLLLTTEAVVCEIKEKEPVGSKRGHDDLDYYRLPCVAERNYFETASLRNSWGRFRRLLGQWEASDRPWEEQSHAVSRWLVAPDQPRRKSNPLRSCEERK